MRFIVDLYRILILLILAIALVLGSWLGISLIGGPLASDPLRLYYATLLVGGFIVIVLGLGITATFISIHDRIADIASQSERAADVLAQGSAR
ncbi:hypothetical protein [Sphingomonas sp. CROZ-RG-20F-R02-07]|uniref:hypothetical protein n=1 Tax=Sphingomonas sp. CROZ-RG-20F-R02-07 TaxID=2914832 RepID=UPI001F55DD19|nr:hypothetical protein [Sphingomonas sp. CROZ-RG-20F-R02-07]